VAREGAYPLWSVTERDAPYFTVFFRQKSTVGWDKAIFFIVAYSARKRKRFI
jgi:hypothetical protein